MYYFTVTVDVDFDLAGVPAALVTTHPLDEVTLAFIEGSKLKVHLCDIRPLYEYEPEHNHEKE
jgi:hypothetical protein